jgi:hypothetical protein
MENYSVYCNLKTELKKKKLKLSDLKNKSSEIIQEIETLEINIEEDINGLNMIFNYIISHKNNHEFEKID